MIMNQDEIYLIGCNGYDNYDRTFVRFIRMDIPRLTDNIYSYKRLRHLLSTNYIYKTYSRQEAIRIIKLNLKGFRELNLYSYK